MDTHDHIGRSPAGHCILVLMAATFLMGSSFVAGKILLTDSFQPMPVGWRFFRGASGARVIG
jgi:hypothetical protein